MSHIHGIIFYKNIAATLTVFLEVEFRRILVFFVVMSQHNVAYDLPDFDKDSAFIRRHGAITKLKCFLGIIDRLLLTFIQPGFIHALYSCALGGTGKVLNFSLQPMQ